MNLNNSKIIKLNNLAELSLYEINKDDIYYFNEYNTLISNKKKEIDNYDNTNWDKMKKLVNPFELIYTTSSKKYKYENISFYKPVSRSYFKLWEIHKDFNLIPNNISNLIVSTLAEGPGGFLEALINLRKKNNSLNYNDHYYGITLNNYNQYIPEWSLKNNQCLKIYYGNLYKYTTTEKYINLFNKNKAHVVTADGGFDYSGDFNGQEINSIHIIFAEMIHSFLILENGGNYLCKFFDLFSTPILKIIYILYSYFDSITIIKPKTSRPANSEKYILCKGFKGITFKEKNNLIKLLENYKENKYYDININLDEEFINSMKHYNTWYVNNQILYLDKVLNLFEEKKLNEEYVENCLKTQISNAVKWCNKYEIIINKKCKYFQKNYSFKSSTVFFTNSS